MIRAAGTVFILLAPAMAAAAPTLGPAYGDGMVLQRGQPVVLQGQTSPGIAVSAELGGDTARARADDKGRFMITLPARPASGSPQSLTIADASGSTAYDNLLVGDVFLCSGQSNMELPVTRALDTSNQLRVAADDGIRLLKIAKTTAPVPQSDFADQPEWQSATGDTVAEFSAACFFMAKELRRRDKSVPIGLIHSNWGGSAARAWLTPAGVRSLYGEEALALLQTYSRDPFAATQEFVPEWFEWWRKEDGGREPWKNPDTLNWQPIPKFSFWNEWTGTGLDKEPRANVWLRQSFTLTADQATQAGSLSVGAIDDMDLTFVNGNPVGYTFGWGVERTYRIPAEFLRAGENEILIAANNMWDTGGFFGGPDRLFFTPGSSGDAIPLGADWEYSKSAVTSVPPRAPWDANAGIGVMHNAMVAPIGPMRLAGVAWYQGESDVGQPDYDNKLRELFSGWRAQFGSDATMMVVQLADYGTRTSEPAASGWAQLRQEQLDAVEAAANAALVTAIDIGEPSDIHPANKNDLGKRLARAFSGEPLPMPDSASLAGGSVTVTFAGIEGGLVALGGARALGVELCGETQDSCRFVTPQLTGNSMVIPADGKPATRVRHAWADAPIVNLYDGRGMPIPGFELEIAQ